MAAESGSLLFAWHPYLSSSSGSRSDRTGDRKQGHAGRSVTLSVRIYCHSRGGRTSTAECAIHVCALASVGHSWIHSMPHAWPQIHKIVPIHRGRDRDLPFVDHRQQARCVRSIKSGQKVRDRHLRHGMVRCATMHGRR